MIIHLTGFVISFSIGILVIQALRVKKLLSLPLCIPLSLIFGLTISSVIFFISLYLFGRYHRGIVLGGNFLILFLFSVIIFLKKPTQAESSFPTQKNRSRPFIFYLLSSLFALGIVSAISILSQQFPYGGWDAWALYNMKAKFLLFAEHHWQNIATSLHWHTQPSYPLLLPLINSWIFSFFQANLIRVASLTSIILCASTGFLLWAGLARFMNTKLAFLGYALLSSNPWWIFWGTTQYADILFSYFLLANFILIALLVKEKNKNLAFFSGVFLGLMTFAKNEGIACSLLLLFLYSTYLFFDHETNPKQTIRLILYLCCGAMIGSSVTLLFRLTIAPATREVQFTPFAYSLPYFNLNGFLMVIRFYYLELLEKEWNFIWIALFLVSILQLPKFFQKECKIFSFFFILYAVILLYVYMSTAHFSLIWRLSCTANRILANLLPSLIFFIFYAIWRKNNIR